MRYIIIINTFWKGWNRFRFADDIFNAFSWMKFALIIISLKFVPRRPVSILTHWGRDKMDAISQTTLSNTFLRMKMLELWLKFVPEGPINNIPALVQIMALVVHRNLYPTLYPASEWPTFSPPLLECCSGTANVDGPNSYHQNIDTDCCMQKYFAQLRQTVAEFFQ